MNYVCDSELFGQEKMLNLQFFLFCDEKNVEL